MRTLTDLERENLSHMLPGYDPQKAHEYYLRTRKLKGRKKGVSDTISTDLQVSAKAIKPKRTRKQVGIDARTKQRHELTVAIKNLQDRLNKLEELIKKREHEEKSENRKSKAKKERATKERDKPKTAAEKADANRKNEKYRDKHKQKLKNEAKKRDSGTSGGGSKDKKNSGSKKHSVSELKSLATKVKGQIEVAKQKLAAL